MVYKVKNDTCFFGLINKTNPWRELKFSVRVLRRFFSDVWWFRGTDSTNTLNLLETALKEHLRVICYADSGSVEVDESIIPKKYAIKRSLVILRNLDENNYAERCGYRVVNHFFFVKSEHENKTSTLKSTNYQEQTKLNKIALKDGQALEIKEIKELFEIFKDPKCGIRTWRK